MNKGSAVSPKVTTPVQQTNNACDKCQSVWCYCEPASIYRFLLFLFPFGPTQLKRVLCPLWVINISSSQQHPSIFYSAAHLFFLCDWPLPFDWICFVPLVSGRANLPHRRSFGLLFHPPTLGRTVCSKDCNLTANLYGFLQGRALSQAQWFCDEM